MSKRYRGSLTGGYGMFFIEGRAVTVVDRYPLGYSQAHYRKVLKERAANKATAEQP